MTCGARARRAAQSVKHTTSGSDGANGSIGKPVRRRAASFARVSDPHRLVAQTCARSSDRDRLLRAVTCWRRQSSMQRSYEQTCSNHRPAEGQAYAARAGQGRHRYRSQGPRQNVFAACVHFHRHQSQTADLLSLKKQGCCRER